jgi:hydrogenase nickel incorporation protein HypA/HybF
MHEYSIIQSLVDSVEKAVDDSRPRLSVEDGRHRLSGQRRAAVLHLTVKIGELSGVDCELLATAFEVFRTGTICERATMTIDRTPVRWSCPKCNAEIPRGEALRCAACKEPAQLTSGDEIILQRIEMEAA